MEGSKAKKVILRILLIIAVILLSIIIVVASCYTFFYYSGKSQMHNMPDNVVIAVPADEIIESDGKVITYKGETYHYNEHVTSVLCIGVDKKQLGIDYGHIGTGGQADAVYLLTVDTLNSKYNVIAISRETMIDVNVYSTTGNYEGVEKMQLCLSYAYGDGEKTSCENTKLSVERLLYNIPINSCFALDCDGISVLNDKVGGVTVPAYDDNGELTGNNITLFGDEAEKYVRQRDINVLTSNNVRITKQLSYLKAFSDKAISNTKKDLTFPVTLFNTVSKYSYTDLNASKITYLAANAFANNKDISVNFKRIEGEVIKGDTGYAEFYPDDEALLELVLEVFYEKDVE